MTPDSRCRSLFGCGPLSSPRISFIRLESCRHKEHFKGGLIVQVVFEMHPAVNLGLGALFFGSDDVP